MYHILREIRNAYTSLVERPRDRWEDNFKIDLKEIGSEGVEWINSG
jgi:hypothetical protein